MSRCCAVSVPSWVLSTSLMLAVVIACSERQEQPPSPSQRVSIGTSWQTARNQPGHVSHVTTKQLACEACHALADPDPEHQGQFDRPKPDRCVACHEAQGQIQHALANSAAELGAGSPSNCMDCHRFMEPKPSQGVAADVLHAQRPHLAGDAGAAHDGQDAWQCQRCHGIGVGTEQQLRTHRFADCARCHTPHGEQIAKPSPCNECHENVVATHGKTHGSVQADCMTCHKQMHAGKAEAQQSCQSCHAEGTPLVSDQAVWEGGHSACTDCHQPHDFGKQQVLGCEGCHQAHPAAIAADKVPQHRTCTNCHDAHNPIASATATCDNCHTQLDNDHPGAAQGSACTSCHPAHPSPQLALQGNSLQCTDCHEQSVHDGVSHAAGVTCTGCHQPHHFRQRKTDAALCQRCHSQQATLVTGTLGHTQCVSCHASDIHLQGNASRPCSSCHGRQVADATMGHVNCQSCHEPHSGVRRVDCRSCHELEHRTATPGHQNCASCHDAHSGKRLASAQCASCHERQSQGPHAALPGGCGDCHRAHGPRGPAEPPACQSCHQAQQLPALHRIPKHDQCGQCHSAHDKRIGIERDTCLSCHQAQRTKHYPEAERCSSCHIFVKL